jgi:tripartite-type tricarboxylate transporter receptor subunit TctC
MRYLPGELVAAVLLFVPQLALAQAGADYPVKPVRVISPSAPGGAVDVLGRLVAGTLSENLKRQFVVENQAGYDVTSWTGWAAPAGTPAAIVNKLSAELGRAVRSPDVVRKVKEDGGTVVGSTSEEFRQVIADEAPRWRRVVKEAQVRME